MGALRDPGSIVVVVFSGGGALVVVVLLLLLLLATAVVVCCAGVIVVLSGRRSLSLCPRGCDHEKTHSRREHRDWYYHYCVYNT